ncbi:hypothetical protein QWY86_11795 [Pedobacter aquatilis]|nr:hypothetical protein [Pedobacter aquatilis]MDN3587356.1 hypothetical protein [Pedobacter aquatilis]
MVKISNEKMSSVNGGAKCIYHVAGLWLGLIGVALNANAVIECWNNSHSE